MDNIFRVLCVFSSEDVQSEFKKITNKLQSEESLRIDPKKILIDYFPNNSLSDYYDAVALDISGKEEDSIISKMILNFNEEFNHSQLVVVCNLNLRDCPALSRSLKGTRSFSFGTSLEAINRIISMQYLFEKEQHLL